MPNWIGVDLDACLAIGHTTEIGEPIPPMVALVQNMLARGVPVRIFTARASMGDVQIKAVKDWCEKVFGVRLPVTNVKTTECLLILDDRAVSIAANQGRLASPEEMTQRLNWVVNTLAQR